VNIADSLQAAKSDIANTTVLSNVISPLISSVAFVATLVIWLETVPKDSVEQIHEMKFQADLAHHRDALVVGMQLTENMRFAHPCFALPNLSLIPS
jgi:hypothetical protein